MSSCKEEERVILSHALQLRNSQQVLLMTYQVLAVVHDGSTYQARELTARLGFVSPSCPEISGSTPTPTIL